MSTVITAENLSKNYLIGHQRTSKSTSLAETIADQAIAVKNRVFHPFSPGHNNHEMELFWALRDINFTISHGQRVGIIGSNGAGKSTLLKILSRITPPSSGKVTLQGRVSSLLEVGTGFHPELSGRENIFLNGAILGMSRNEIERKFDAIVNFSEVEKFLDTPVKRYSSGMYVRLAFAVAAHLEPEILIVDEVLAVGDAAFQRKCLGKMGEVSSEGRTVLFVSHNLNAIQQLCDSAIYLKDGRIVEHVDGIDQVDRLISNYYSEQIPHDRKIWKSPEQGKYNPWFSPTAFYTCDENGKPHEKSIRFDQEINLCIEGHIESLSEELALGFILLDEFGSPVFVSKYSDNAPQDWPKLRSGNNTLLCKIPPRFLNEGIYKLRLIAHLVGSKQWLFKPRDSEVNIEISIQGGFSDSPHWMKKRLGTVAPLLEWQQTL